VANRHYAKIADVWKHLPLTELLAVERPLDIWSRTPDRPSTH
jgi:hypothetical protein